MHSDKMKKEKTFAKWLRIENIQRLNVVLVHAMGLHLNFFLMKYFIRLHDHRQRLVQKGSFEQ